MEKINLLGYAAYTASFLIASALSWYLYSLARRTSFFSRAAAVGLDVVVIVAILCLINFAILMPSCLMFSLPPRIVGIVLIVLHSIVSLSYFVLYLAGMFGSVTPN